MKKKLLALAVGFCTIISLAACGSKDSETETESKITLGQYKGIEVEKSVATITDEELQEYIDSILKSNQTTENIEEGTTKKDDKILAVYSASMDGTAVSDLSSAATGSTVTLSDSGFAIKGFVDQLIDKKVGDTVEFDIKIQDDFASETYAGKTVHYKVEIKAIVITKTPELTDAFVKDTFGYMGLNNIAEFKEHFKNDLFLNSVYYEIGQTILDNQKVENYNKKEVSESMETTKKNYESQIYYSYNIDLATYLAAVEMTEEEFEEKLEEEVKASLKEKMFVNKVAEAEGITVSDDEYSAKMLEYAKGSGFDTVEEFTSYYDGTYDNDFYKYIMLSEKVQVFICDNIKIVEDKETTTPEEIPYKEETTTPEATK